MTEVTFTNPSSVAPLYLRRHVLDLLSPLWWSIVMLVPLVILLVALQTLGLADEPAVETGMWLFGGLYLVFVVNFFMMQWIFWYMDVWVLLPERLIDIQLISLFNRRVSQMNLNQVQDVRVSMQGVLASLIRFGNITVQSAGKEGFFELRSIPNARDVADLITSYSERSRSEGVNEIAARVTRPIHRLGEILISRQMVSPSDLTMALQEQQGTGKRLGRILLDKKIISRDDLVQALGSQYHIPSLDLSRYEIDPAVVRVMPYDLATKYSAIPIARSPEAITVAIADPSPEATGELSAQFDTPLAFTVADEDYIREAITGFYLAGRDEEPGGDDASGGSSLEDLGIE
ncbi:MAG: type IV-A pilus assembly ATPase PilB, type IV pilus assembly protein PilB [candidate division Kazan bacterium GW2011_GWA1_50_15]|uniref:Type IV-A pilus assembly ATPase PilB n=2 Tax=Bacteria division Kazan-3B-28 TaxID=1798534 RepID=A0A0G1X837_UNCK3|nr:MAG: type IV-A pilus assembly ATPase PilB, type IV pilus assembly protein PilB [candidate division Kazan bacterium GW2011_GWA1_50_15]KKW25845.1 MAG: Type IV-A pilus assembly ATPase PilB [candidate division Kazan bacterium GW2011_GWC1_52_13]KKW27141.1 MAG: Type IV-A pilus assembly ATPase PilB [candidate division Kazan bacterium GW2011_GWB1_52_7]HCR42429.1 hypothetical protein [Patescibacteria group bacterium]